MSEPTTAPEQLNIRELMSGRRFLVMGGTGFLGKVWLSMVLHRFPDIEATELWARGLSEKSYGYGPKKTPARERL